MMRNVALQVVVNGRFLARRVTGVERYGREILQCIGHDCSLESTRWQGWRGHAWEQFILPASMREGSVLWSPANTGPVMVRRQALTVHDLSPLEHPEWFQKRFSVWYRLFLPVLLKRVQRVFTPSDYVKQKVIHRFGIKDVVVTPNGVDQSLFHPYARQTHLDVPGKYVLFVGTLEPRKNLERLFQAWNEIKDEFTEMWLLVAGVSGNVFKSIRVSRDMDRVRFLGYVDDQTLAGLYARSSLFVLPSQDEGFGLPALEAMASGAPVLVSDGGALPEVVNDAGMTFCLSDPHGLKQSMKECLSNAGLREELREKGLERAKKFSWQTTAEIVWKNLHVL
jgi:glycosyltransferase involved in cell wall biosynthesis